MRVARAVASAAAILLIAMAGCSGGAADDDLGPESQTSHSATTVVAGEASSNDAPGGGGPSGDVEPTPSGDESAAIGGASSRSGSSGDRTVSATGPRDRSRSSKPYVSQEPDRDAITAREAKELFSPLQVLQFAEEDMRTRSIAWYQNSTRLEALAVPKDLSPERDDEQRILVAGGYQLLQGRSDSSVILGKRWGKSVSVRGQPAMAFLAGTLYGDREVCNVSWSEPADGGRFLTYLMRSQPGDCSQEAVAVANRLTPLP